LSDKVVRVRSRTVIYEVLVASKEYTRSAGNIAVVEAKKRNQVGQPDVGWRIILRWIVRRKAVRILAA
jgi:hypothetical protein